MLDTTWDVVKSVRPEALPDTRTEFKDLGFIAGCKKSMEPAPLAEKALISKP